MKRNVQVIAIAQEEADVESHRKIWKHAVDYDGHIFELLADIGHEKTKMYHQTTAYLIDRKGIIRQIFPMTVRDRGSWKAILEQVDTLID